MTTALTFDQAIALLHEQPGEYDTPNKLRALAAQVDADAPGRVTVLYSGPSAKGVSSSNIIESLLESGEDVRVIDRSDAAKLLQSDEFLHSVAKAFGLDDFRPLADRSYRGPAADWLYHPTRGPWADASARFADATIGEVRAIVGDANPDRVFAATEIPRILANENVPTIEGISREALVARQSTHGTQAAFEMIVARSREHVGLLRVASDVPVNYAGELLRDGRGRIGLDSRDYFAATGLEGKAPAFQSQTRALVGNMTPPSGPAQAGLVHLLELQTQQFPAQGVRINAAGKAVGVLAAAGTAYDLAETTHDVGRLRAQGNTAAAEDRITRFAAQNLGGWTGAAAGFGAGAVAGVETGPGLLVTGAVGGVIGAVAGNEIADWIRAYKINHQDDRQGITWTFDPARPEKGWTLDVPPLPGTPQGQRLTADPALSDQLTFKASSRSIALALGAPPQNRNPYRFAAEATDGQQRSPFETGRDWVRDTQTGQWQQEITALVDGRIPVTRKEPVSAERAMQLEQRSQAIIAQNAQQTPAAMASQFQAAYERNGWSQYGALPDAVTDALRHPGRVVSSEGALYERNAQGQWTHDGVIKDRQAAGPLRQELEATYQAQQRASLPITTLEPVLVRPDPVQARDATSSAVPAPSRDPARSGTALPESFAPALQPSADLRNPNHPGHDAFARTLSEVHRAETTRGVTHGPHREQVAAALTVEAVRSGQGITNVEIRADGRIVGLERSYASVAPKEVAVDTRDALSVPSERYSAQWAELRSPHLAGMRQPAVRNAEQAQSLAQLSPQDEALFARIRQGVPAHIADGVVAHAMLQAKREGISDADKIDRVAMAGDKLWIAGTTPGYRVAVDVAAAPPDLPDTVQRNEDFNRQREQQVAMEAAQREQQQTFGRGVSA